MYPYFCYILCYTLGVLGGSVTAVGQRIRGLEDGGRSCLFRTSRSIKIPFRNALEPPQNSYILYYSARARLDFVIIKCSSVKEVLSF